ncbi:uncharacterized protein LOC127257654 [Andrographis paniculata]|uniref:uncharacterized protein LOC127257654 n=1 Tax=Andrographis paniculata TaxID=175694 RepID=UPI0021E78DF2|nr:uncharacterized protein LOC127257654 [Andrographis paniculata]XP_051140069.1 uncharacterized protein LOC127257654 [Andrographis paniculata]XP_051140070.1 uncharacterized protein LOC127257654 [Andrographis paniculata]XP_051140071.1 uncharacterized protein LOC127257654 [Andrographis paniculata]XP_051140072.1 uncharacterized protein LOC127257654 [Andrographis paniculata]XP_051140073.1 uncharacterized protein LOC127257654 [Andrographis paniculata]
MAGSQPQSSSAPVGESVPPPIVPNAGEIPQPPTDWRSYVQQMNNQQTLVMQNMLREQQNLMQNMLDQALSRVSLQPTQTPPGVSPSRLQANFAGPSFVDSAFPSATNPNRTDRGKSPLTFPNTVPLGPRVSSPQPNNTREDRPEGHIHDPIHIPVQDPFHVPDHQRFHVDPDEIAHILRDQFGLTPQMANRPAYQRPFPERIINEHPLPRNYRPPDFHAFSGEDGSSTIEHVGRFTVQLGEVGNNPFYKLQLFGLSLTRTAFSWFASLPPGQIQTWEGLEMAFHARFFNPLPTVSLTDLLELRQYPEESASQFIERVRLMKGRCPTVISEKEMTNLVVRNMHTRLGKALTALDVEDLASLASKAGRLESLFREEDQNNRRNRGQHMASMGTETCDFDFNQSEEMAAEILSGKPYVCPKLKPVPGSEGKDQPTFDSSKADEIFDILLTDGQIRIPKGQRLATKEEIKGRPYCKWHNSFTHNTSQCTHFRKEIQKAIKIGRLKYITLGVDQQPFPKVTTSMVDIQPSSETEKNNSANSGQTGERTQASPGTKKGSQPNSGRPEERLKVCEKPVAEKWDNPDGSFNVEVKEKVLVRDHPTRKTGSVGNNWARNKKPLPVDIDPRFPGMNRTQIRNAKRRYAAKYGKRVPSTKQLTDEQKAADHPAGDQSIRVFSTEQTTNEQGAAIQSPKNRSIRVCSRKQPNDGLGVSEYTKGSSSGQGKGKGISDEIIRGFRCQHCERININPSPEEFRIESLTVQSQNKTKEEVVTTEENSRSVKSRLGPRIPCRMTEINQMKDEPMWASLLDDPTDEPLWAVLADNELEETEWAKASDPESQSETPSIVFPPIPEGAISHLKPLYVNAHICGKPITKVFVDNGAVFNVMPLKTLKKLGKGIHDLSPVEFEMTSFTGQPTKPEGMMVATIEVGPKKISTVFFIVDADTTYSLLLGRDWIHASQCVPSTLHQQLMFWEGNQVFKMEANDNPFDVSEQVEESVFYSSHLVPMSQLYMAREYPNKGYKVTGQNSMFY